MRILHTSDLHLGKNLEGVSRMDEQEAFLEDFVEIVKENNVDIVIIAGENGERLILVIEGNHDNPERLVAAGPLAREHGIIMVGTPKTIVEAGQYGEHEVVNSGEGFIEIKIKGERAVILTVPYPSEKRLDEVLYTTNDEEEDKVKIYGDRIKMLFDTLGKNFREDTINLVVSHLFAMGSEEGGSERNVMLGGSFIVDGNCFPEAAQYIALGHVHKPQIIPGSNKKARYSGSPLHYNKKEIHFTKKCYLADIKAGEEAKVSDIEFKIYKPIEIWKCNSVDEAIEMCKSNGERECFVYLEIETDRYIREDEIKQMKSAKDDILEIMPKIKGEEVEDIDLKSFSEKSFEEIFKEFYFKERKVEPQKEVVELLLSIISEGEEDYETN